MTLKKTEETLYQYLIKEKDEIVLSISGEWGIGKTYFWNNSFLDKYKNELKDKQIAYVSLFGATSLNDIRTSILLQSSKTKNRISWLNKKISTPMKNFKSSLKIDDEQSMSFGLNSISSVLSILSSGDFKNVIVCFDDFERMSSKIDFKDILGLISELKEQKKCKIIMIINEEELKKLSSVENETYDKVFNLYKEKIIDVELPFKPTTNENFEFSTKRLNSKIDKSILQEFFNNYKIVNIRIMQQVINKLNELFIFINIEKYDNKIQNEFLFISMRAFLLQIKFNIKQDEFNKIKKINFNSLFTSQEDKNDDNKLDEKQEEILFYIDNHADEIIENIMFDYINNSKLNNDYLYNILDERQDNLSIYESKNLISESWHALHTDFSYTKQECSETLWKTFKENTNNLHNILGLEDFHYYVKFLNDMEQDIDDEFINKILKQYIDKLIEQEKSISIHEEFNQDFIKDNYPDLLKYWQLEKEKKLLHEIDITTIEEILDKVKSGWGDKDQYILNNIGVEDYKTHIISSVSFVKSIMSFLSSKRNDTTYFVEAIKNIKLAFQELREENDDYKFKVDKIIKQTKIKLDI